MTATRHTSLAGRALVGLVAVVAACSDSGESGYSPDPPTQAEARAFLDEAVRLAQAGDDDAFCDLTIAEIGCSAALENHGPAPDDDPVVVLSRVYEEQVAGLVGTPASRILGVCVGDLYTEVAVFRTRSGGFEFQSPVYWTGATISRPELDGDGDGIVEAPLEPDHEVPDC